MAIRILGSLLTNWIIAYENWRWRKTVSIDLLHFTHSATGRILFHALSFPLIDLGANVILFSTILPLPFHHSLYISALRSPIPHWRGSSQTTNVAPSMFVGCAWERTPFPLMSPAPFLADALPRLLRQVILYPPSRRIFRIPHTFMFSRTFSPTSGFRPIFHSLLRLAFRSGSSCFPFLVGESTFSLPFFFLTSFASASPSRVLAAP